MHPRAGGMLWKRFVVANRDVRAFSVQPEYRGNDPYCDPPRRRGNYGMCRLNVCGKAPIIQSSAGWRNNQPINQSFRLPLFPSLPLSFLHSIIPSFRLSFFPSLPPSLSIIPGRRSRVRFRDCSSFHSAISLSLPESRTSGTFQPLNSAGRV